MPRLRVYKQVLPCQLRDEEIQAKGEALGKMVQELGEVENEKKLANNGFKERIDALDGSIQKTSREINSKSEDREVEVEEYLIPDDRKVVLTRMDSKERLSDRPASDDEMLHGPNLFDGPGDNGPSVGGFKEPKPFDPEDPTA